MLNIAAPAWSGGHCARSLARAPVPISGKYQENPMEIMPIAPMTRPTPRLGQTYEDL